jgi:hypothetical protein
VIVLPSPTGLISCPADTGVFCRNFGQFVLSTSCARLHRDERDKPERGFENKKTGTKHDEAQGRIIVFMPAGI